MKRKAIVVQQKQRLSVSRKAHGNAYAEGSTPEADTASAG